MEHKQMEILFVAMEHDYGDPDRGYSFEHWNFFNTLERMGHNLQYFDFMALQDNLGHKRMNTKLKDMVTLDKPDLLFCFLFEDELDKKVIKWISEETDTLTLNWFADDHWRFENYSRHWATEFNWVVTTSESALTKYKAAGIGNVIKSQWGVNHHVYRDLDLPLLYDVTFIGQPHGNRREVITELREAGIRVQTWGYGWEDGRLDQDQMIRTINQSKINLNLSQASTSLLVKGAVSPFERRLRRIYKRSIGKVVNLGGLYRRVAGSRITTNDDQNLPEQIKARNFEIPGCRSFQISSQAENLEDYFENGREIVLFSDTGDLINKIKYYLDHSGERLEIADAGYQRVIKEHTYAKRFNVIFKTIGLQ